QFRTRDPASKLRFDQRTPCRGALRLRFPSGTLDHEPGSHLATRYAVDVEPRDERLTRGRTASSTDDASTPCVEKERTVIVRTPLRRTIRLACQSGRTSATCLTGTRTCVTGDVT